jgi:glycosyltransferase involved in cell wall biosynthesis
MISIICPIFNEEKYLPSLIEFFLISEPKERELYLIDGGSTDKTIEIIEKYIKKYENIKLIKNPDKYVSFGLNKAIPLCRGDIIVRLDAHTEYSDDYLTSIIQTFEETGADIVGGPMRVVGKTKFQKAVAHATTNLFGIGDSKFHGENNEGYVDSVYLGAWKKDIFNDTGLFDEKMIRNQDDEFHYRAKSLGKKIYLNPKIKSYYYPRENIRSLFKQYYQYGLYKPLVLRKIQSEIKARHLIPPLFTFYILSLPIVIFNKYWIIPFLLYIALDILNSITIRNDFKSKIYALIVFPVIHISYGLGFLKSILIKNK